MKAADRRNVGGHDRLAIPGEARQPLVRLLLIFFVFAFAGMASRAGADTIHLKNGKEIVGQVTRQDSLQVHFERDGNDYAIPRSLVDHIEKSSPDSAEESASGRAARRPDLPLAAPAVADSLVGSMAVKDGAVNDAYLKELDRRFARDASPANARDLAEGYVQAAMFLARQGHPEQAIAEYRHALIFEPENLSLTLGLGDLMIEQNHYWEAVQTLSPAADAHPQSAGLRLLLGSAYYGMEDLPRAIHEWKISLALYDNPALKAALLRAETEQGATGSFQELRSPHFVLRYDEGKVRGLANQMLETLENDFLALEQDLDFYPQEPIVVVLYPDQAFRDITRLPSWVGAVNDGKIRIPVSGLSSMTPDLARILKHELTHSFVHRMTLGRCPVWFNEGLAQLEEGASTAPLTAPLVQAFPNLPPYSALERSFLNLPPAQVALVYAQSLAALEYLRDTYGLVEIRRLLNRLRANPDFNAALEQELRLDYSHFEQEVLNYLSRRSP